MGIAFIFDMRPTALIFTFFTFLAACTEQPYHPDVIAAESLRAASSTTCPEALNDNFESVSDGDPKFSLVVKSSTRISGGSSSIWLTEAGEAFYQRFDQTWKVRQISANLVRRIIDVVEALNDRAVFIQSPGLRHPVLIARSIYSISEGEVFLHFGRSSPEGPGLFAEGVSAENLRDFIDTVEADIPELCR